MICSPTRQTAGSDIHDCGVSFLYEEQWPAATTYWLRAVNQFHVFARWKCPVNVCKGSSNVLNRETSLWPVILGLSISHNCRSCFMRKRYKAAMIFHSLIHIFIYRTRNSTLSYLSFHMYTLIL